MKKVSILVFVDVALEPVSRAFYIYRICRSFNSCFRGCRSGTA